MNGLIVVVAGGIGILVAIEIGHKFSFINQCLFQSAGTLREFMGEILQISVGSQPVITQNSRPICPVHSFPLPVEIPSKWNWSKKTSALKCFSKIQLLCRPAPNYRRDGNHRIRGASRRTSATVIRLNRNGFC